MAVRVAVCIAGQWRDWSHSWPHIRAKIVDALDADVYAVSDTSRIAFHGRADFTFNVTRMRQTFGSRFHGGEQLSSTHMANVSGHTWPEIAAVQAEKGLAFHYLYKIWRCGQLIHKSGIQYDAVIRLRPDLWPQQAFRIARIAPSDADGAGDNLELQVGGRCVRFGGRSIVVHAYTNFCGNDWLAIGGLQAMTVTMDLLRFMRKSRFFSPDAAFDSRLAASVELAHNWLWWRTGTAVLRRPLFIELSRRRCARANCLRMPAWQVMPQLRPPLNASRCVAHPKLPLAPIGTMQPGRYGLVNDCGALGGGDLEWFTGPMEPHTPQVHSVAAANASRPAARVEPPRLLLSATTPTWTRPTCGDVDDLATHDPLPACKKATGDNESYRPGAHRPRVQRGYGVGLVYRRNNRTKGWRDAREHTREHKHNHTKGWREAREHTREQKHSLRGSNHEHDSSAVQ